MAHGLQTHIWNNNLKSIFLLCLYPIIMIGLVWGASFVVSAMSIADGNSVQAQGFANGIVFAYWPIIVTVIVIWFVVSYFFHSFMIRKMSHARPVTRIEEPELYNLLENLCISQGMPMPRLNIIESHGRNAFASGIDTKSFAVTVTRGLMNSLTKDELESVLAHELAHILNRDVRLLMVTVIFTGMIGFAAQMVWSHIRYGFIYSGDRRGKGNGILVMMAIGAVLWVGYMATLFMRFALSRRREYMADAGAVQMTKNPEAMMRALMRISGRDHIPETTDDIMMMCVENRRPFLGLFATHPPIEQRIKALSAITNTPVPSPASLPPVRVEKRFGIRAGNPWITRGRRGL